MDFLQLAGKPILIFGVANRKSVAWHVGRVLERGRGRSASTWCRTKPCRESVAKLLGRREVYVCDVEHEDADRPAARRNGRRRSGSTGWCIRWPLPITRRGCGRSTKRPQGVPAVRRYFLLLADGALPGRSRTVDADASVVTISISTTRMASENYGYMAPVRRPSIRRWPSWPSRSAVFRASGSTPWRRGC